MRDIANNLHFVPAFTPKAAVTDNTAQVSAILDRAGFNAVALALVTGAESDADATFTMLLEEADASDMTGAVAVADKDLKGTEALASFDFAGDNVCRKLGYTGGKRYLRATLTPANNTGNLFLSGMWVLGKPAFAPTVNPPA
jgi:hypothetical protein